MLETQSTMEAPSCPIRNAACLVMETRENTAAMQTDLTCINVVWDPAQRLLRPPRPHQPPLRRPAAPAIQQAPQALLAQALPAQATAFLRHHLHRLVVQRPQRRQAFHTRHPAPRHLPPVCHIPQLRQAFRTQRQARRRHPLQAFHTQRQAPPRHPLQACPTHHTTRQAQLLPLRQALHTTPPAHLQGRHTPRQQHPLVAQYQALQHTANPP